MPAAELPPLRTRLGFWLLGRRVPPQHRPWAAAQITSPTFSRRRMRGLLALQVVLVALPQVALALTSGGLFNLVLAAGLVTVFAVAARLTPAATPDVQQRLLAHQGVTATGELVPPVSMWQSPYGRGATAALVANVLVLGTGLVVAGDRLVSPDRCRDAPRSEVALLAQRLEPPAARLEGVQRVDAVLDGVHYVAAYVRRTDGERRGPVVWRVLEPGGAVDVPALLVTSADLEARAATPSLGSSSGTGEDPLLDKARSCARAAAD